MNSKNNYRVYDLTGGGVTHDIYAETLDDAVASGRGWIEAGDWSGSTDTDHEDGVIAVCRTIRIECCVGLLLSVPAEDAPSSLPLLSQYGLTRQSDGSLLTHISASDHEHGRIVSEGVASGLYVATVALAPCADGDWPVTITPSAAWPTEIIEDDEQHDCSGTYTDPEPDCPVAEGWDWVGTASDRNAHYEVCRNTGCYRDTASAGSQRNPGDPLEIVTYLERDDMSEAYVVERHTDDDGYIPEWLAEYLGRSVTTRMTEDDITAGRPKKNDRHHRKIYYVTTTANTRGRRVFAKNARKIV